MKKKKFSWRSRPWPEEGGKEEGKNDTYNFRSKYTVSENSEWSGGGNLYGLYGKGS